MTTEMQEFSAEDIDRKEKKGSFIREFIEPGMSFHHREFREGSICTVTKVTEDQVTYVRESDGSEHEFSRRRFARLVQQWADSPGIRAEKEAAHRVEIIVSLESVYKKYLNTLDDTIDDDPLTAWTKIIEALEGVAYESYEAGYAAGRKAAVPTAG